MFGILNGSSSILNRFKSSENLRNDGNQGQNGLKLHKTRFIEVQI